MHSREDRHMPLNNQVTSLKDRGEKSVLLLGFSSAQHDTHTKWTYNSSSLCVYLWTQERAKANPEVARILAHDHLKKLGLNSERIFSQFLSEFHISRDLCLLTTPSHSHPRCSVTMASAYVIPPTPGPPCLCWGWLDNWYHFGFSL